MTTEPAQQPKSEKSEQLLAVATELFAERGIGTVSIDLILEHADAAAPTLYRLYKRRRYKAKPALVVDSLKRWSADYLARLRDALAPGRDARDRLDRLFAFLGGWFNEQEAFRGSYVMNVAAELAAVEALSDHAAVDARKVIEEHQRQEHALLVGLAKSADVRDPEDLADELQLIVYGAIDRARLAAPDQRPLIVETARAIAHAMLEQAMVTTPVEQ